MTDQLKIRNHIYSIIVFGLCLMDNVGFILFSTRTVALSLVIIIVLSLKGIIENTCRLAKDSFYQVHFHSGLAGRSIKN